MGNAFVAGPKNEASRGRDMTNEERKSEVSHKRDEIQSYRFDPAITKG